MKNNFKQLLDSQLKTVFYDTEKFGIEENSLLYYPGGGTEAVPLTGIFDRTGANNPTGDSNSDFIDNRPQLRMREVDFEQYSIAENKFPDTRSDRVSIDGELFEFVEYTPTDTGETVCFLMEVDG